MEISVLSSGSHGNSIYLGNNGSGLLFDVGITNKDICNRLSLIDKSIENIKGVFISHEHADHVRGLNVCSQKNDLKIFANKKSMDNYCFPYSYNNILNNQLYSIAGMKVMPISVSHDAANTFGFLVKNGTKRVGIFTDLGFVNDEVKKIIGNVDSLVLESNHDYDMLENGRYPFHLKERIKSKFGHLSNFDTGIAVMENASPRLKNVFLAHLSENNNRKDIAMETFEAFINERKDLDINVSMTDQKEPTSLRDI